MTPAQLATLQAAALRRITEHINRSAAAHLREWRKRWKQ
jgi:hypothetical protein